MRDFKLRLDSFECKRVAALGQHETLGSEREESKVHVDMRSLRSVRHHRLLAATSLGLVLIIGLVVAGIAAALVFVAAFFHRLVSAPVEAAMVENRVIKAAAIFILVRLALVLVAAGLTIWQPMSAGSGLSQLKSYLNGTDLPGFLSAKTLLAKAAGIGLVISTGLPLGKEGPMVHIGSAVAASLSRLEAGWLHDLLELRLPSAQREWIGMGAAAGVAGAFNAPLGGILYSFEEVCSHWSAQLTWRAFMCGVVVSVTANALIASSDGELHGGGFVLGGAGDNLLHVTLHQTDFLWFVLLSILGGILGAAYTAGVHRMNLLRRCTSLVAGHRGRSWRSVCFRCSPSLCTSPSPSSSSASTARPAPRAATARASRAGGRTARRLAGPGPSLKAGPTRRASRTVASTARRGSTTRWRRCCTLARRG